VATFADSAGRTWDVVFTVAAMKRVRDRHGVNLAELAGNEFKNYVDVAGDPVKLAEVLHTLCGKQHPDVSLDDFMESLVGDAIHHAAEAFQGAFISFCPSRQREVLTALAAKTEAMHAEAMTLAMAEINAATFSPTATASPASSASIPAA
jgi:hypothetical protein